ncbi:hypothetical protein IEQ34_000282 [Dendrobium chrysotoxum]|uniref:DUF4283 domain-containing protein n=1 Tax=Dendrobium chrysotoxum TaxID=161865 RepID=A0AAV7HQS8_DENCH|nr:hypothetical protein IEQ34_000282 [Dendrobium chrysotoxum]
MYMHLTYVCSRDNLQRLGGLAGSPIQAGLKVDNATALGSRPSVALVLVEIDITKKFSDKIWIGPENLGYFQQVTMEDFPLFYSKCKRLGHSFGDCRPPLDASLFAAPSLSKSNLRATDDIVILVGDGDAGDLGDTVLIIPSPNVAVSSPIVLPSVNPAASPIHTNGVEFSGTNSGSLADGGDESLVGLGEVSVVPLVDVPISIISNANLRAHLARSLFCGNVIGFMMTCRLLEGRMLIITIWKLARSILLLRSVKGKDYEEAVLLHTPLMARLGKLGGPDYVGNC